MDQKEDNPAKKPGISSLQGKMYKNRGDRLNTLNRRILTFLFFLLLSIVFWLLTALNKEYSTVISYPVKYTRIPDELVLMNDVAEQLDLDVVSRGFTLLRLKMQSRLSPIILDVNSFSLNSSLGESPIFLYLVTSLILEKMQQQLTPDIRIKSVHPDTVILQLTDKFTRKIAVKPDLELEFERQFMQVGRIEVTPDSVVVSGPENLVDTLTTVTTFYDKLTGLKKNTDLDIALKPIHKLEFSISDVRIHIPIEKFTEESIKIPIEVMNIPDSIFLRTFPANIEITYRVGLSDYEKVSEHMFLAVIDYSARESSIGNKLAVELVKVPENVQITNFYPRSVEYIIEK